jgi:vitamin B12/bleomycin/antimicrobial peptide transport system ATP-binding/permease protein
VADHHLFDRWLINGRYYQLHLVQGDHKNPEYRIADDVRLATDSPVDFATGVTTAILSALTFIVVLWTIGGSLSFNLAGIEITIPGFLVVAAVAYAVLASGSMVFIGRRFVTASEHKNQSEAEFRYVLTRLSENGESIAVLGGEDEERNAVNRSLRTVLRRWRDICFQTMRTTIISQTSSYVKLMELLTKELGATTIVSVGHRPELEAFHNRKIVLERRSAGAKFVTDIRLRSHRFLRKWRRPRQRPG